MDWPVQPNALPVNDNAAADWSSDMSSFAIMQKTPHESHPAFGHLVLLVFEAVLEVVCVSLPGYIIARLGHFDAEKQKFLANLNVMLFTPCLIFTKLASQLNGDKLIELGIIPVIFVVQTLVSYFVSVSVSKVFRFKKRPANFVTAMGVFGNSNSLPISLVISLSQTLKGLHWDKIPGDNNDEVAARGILYLMIFQQLGQMVRWSWGYHVLLAPKERYHDYQEERIEEGYTDEPPPGAGGVLIPGLDGGVLEGNRPDDDSETSSDSDVYEPAGRTPIHGASRASFNGSEEEDGIPRQRVLKKYRNGADGSNGLFVFAADESDDGISSFPRMHEVHDSEVPDGIRGYPVRAKLWYERSVGMLRRKTTETARHTYQQLPASAQTFLTAVWGSWLRVYKFLWEFMNPPLWAMLIAVIVASVPKLHRIFFEEGSFIKNSVTSAISSSAGVAVPLILVVLGANLARNTQPIETRDTEEDEIGTKLLIASLLSRMLLPTVIMAPFLAIFAKFVPVSILDDPIFIIVCFLLTGAPSALQLAQICQINSVYEGVMSKILFQSYVIWILPSTLMLVMLALETVEWAKP